MARPVPNDVEVVIEPARGATYNRPGKFAAYGYSEYPESSVLAGQTRRQWLGEFDSVAEALVAYPNAEVDASSRYQGPDLSHLPADSAD